MGTERGAETEREKEKQVQVAARGAKEQQAVVQFERGQCEWKANESCMSSRVARAKRRSVTGRQEIQPGGRSRRIRSKTFAATLFELRQRRGLAARELELDERKERAGGKFLQNCMAASELAENILTGAHKHTQTLERASTVTTLAAIMMRPQ